jgi:hypothetical protein
VYKRQLLQGALMLFPIYVRSRAGTTATLSHMWLFMLGAETVLMLMAAGLYARLGARITVAIGVCAGALRWLACAFCTQLTWVYPLQALHGVQIVALSLGAPLLVESLVPGRLRASGQAGLSLFGALGGIVSATLAGRVFDAYGIETVLLLSGTAGLGLALAVPRLLPPESAAPALTQPTAAERPA